MKNPPDPRHVTDRDLERLVREGVSPRGDVDPPAGLRARVLRDAVRRSASRRAAGGALLRLLFPYAAGVLTVLAVQTAVPSSPARDVRPAIPFLGAIADRAPLPPPAVSADPSSEDAPPAVETASAPVPRIS